MIGACAEAFGDMPGPVGTVSHQDPLIEIRFAPKIRRSLQDLQPVRIPAADAAPATAAQ
jgi:hypothetical protein